MAVQRLYSSDRTAFADVPAEFALREPVVVTWFDEEGAPPADCVVMTGRVLCHDDAWVVSCGGLFARLPPPATRDASDARRRVCVRSHA